MLAWAIKKSDNLSMLNEWNVTHLFIIYLIALVLYFVFLMFVDCHWKLTTGTFIVHLFCPKPSFSFVELLATEKNKLEDWKY